MNLLNEQSNKKFVCYYRVACYSRLSKDDEQDGTSVSITTQRQVLEDYCRSNGWEIFDFYYDDGYTGTNFNRPDFKRMMDDIQSGLVNMVIVKDLSRLGRNYIEVGKLIEEVFPLKGVRFIAIGDDVDTDRENLDLDLVLPMKNVFNQYYPADCSRKTRQAFKTKSLRGEFIGSYAPYGYRKSAEDKHVLEIDDQTAPIVLRMFEMAAYEGCGYNKITRILSEQKVITPSAYQAQISGRAFGKDPFDWNLTTVYKMMVNETYLGHTINGRKRKLSFKSKRVINQPEDKWIVVPNTHVPLISEQLWEDAHKRLESRKRESKLGEINIFAGLIKCDKCGYALCIKNTRGRPRYFCCNTYSKKGKEKCSIHYIPYKDLYDAVLTDLKSRVCSIQHNEQSFVQGILKKLDSTNDKNAELAGKQTETIKNRIAELEQRYNRLYEDRLNGVISVGKFKELADKCEAEQETLRSQVADIQKQSEQQMNTIHNVSRFVEVIKRYSEIEVLDKELLNRLIDRIEVSDRAVDENGNETQQIRIIYKFLGTLNEYCTAS